MAQLTVSIKEQDQHTFSPAQSRNIQPENIVEVRENSDSEAVVYYLEENQADLVKLVLDSTTLASLKSTLSSKGVTFKEVTLLEYEGVSIDGEPTILLQEPLMNGIQGNNDNGSDIQYNRPKRVKNTLIKVKESPAAIVAGNTSS